MTSLFNLFFFEVMQIIKQVNFIWPILSTKVIITNKIVKT